MDSQKRSVILILSLIILLLPAFTASAQTDLAPIRVGWAYYPGGMEVHDGVYSGFLYDYLMEIAKYTHWNYEFVETDLGSASQMLQEGKIDLLGLLLKTDEREMVFDFPTESIGNCYTTLFTSVESHLETGDFDSYNGITIGTVKDSVNKTFLEEFASDFDFRYETKDYPQIDAVMEAVARGEVDSAILGTYYHDERFRVLAEFAPQPYYLATTKGNKAILVELNRALASIKMITPFFGLSLYNKYYEPSAITHLTSRENEIVAASQKNPITIGIIPNTAPTCYLDEKSGEPIGIYIDLMNLISQNTGLQFDYREMDLSAGPPVTHLKTGEVDLVSGILRTDNFMNDPELLLTDNLFQSFLVMVGVKGTDFTSNPSQKRIAILNGFQVAEEFISENFPLHERISCSNTERCLQMVASGQADATISIREFISLLLQNPHYENLEVSDVFTTPIEIVIGGLSKNGSALTSTVNKGLRLISDDERNELIIDYTLMNPYQLTMGDVLYKYRYPLYIILILVILVISGLLFLDYYRRRNSLMLEQAYDQEKKALQLAEQASTAKGNFMMRMSHEIRTPLNAVIGFILLARDQISSTADGKPAAEVMKSVDSYLEKSQTASHHLLTVINDVLDMSAIESGKIQVMAEPFNFGELIASINMLYSSQAQARSVNFSTITECEINKWLIGDRMRLNQILNNLLSNAVKFTPANGSVELHVGMDLHEDNSCQVHLSIHDSGIGMSPEFMTRIFEPFEQADSSVSRRFGGTGLGLSITSNLIDLMGGKIHVESTENVGTSFFVELPFLIAEHDEADDIGQPEEKILFDGERILLAEDNKMNMEITCGILERNGITVDKAWNGREAVDRFIAEPAGTYKVILMDVQMPVLDGNSAVREIRACDKADAQTVTIFALTADAFADSVSESMKSGMNGHFSKPIDIQALTKKLKEVLHGE